ncbi:hypothetical protein OTJ42_03655 [Citrobacter braakii]|uniref:hypothetical protein n=1 Tax=Enterobacteriaceae TaxID=543 RepID=UPI00093D91D6|nr:MULTISPECIES: hypothetical protein [Enterobacteriaceae]MCY9797555.1 hypothetical protein [Citrobacter braakii]
MNNKTVNCPFCFKESRHGVLVCTGCQSTITYGLVPAKYAVFFLIVILPITFAALVISQSFLLAIAIFFASAIFLRIHLKKKFADRVIFTHKS